MKVCYNCGTAWVAEKKQPAVKETCASCVAYLHCCLNCRHYDKHAHNKCKIPTTDWVADRRGPNFCDEFEFADSTGAKDGEVEKHQARDGFQDLFGGATGQSAGAQKSADDFRRLLGGK